MSKWITPFPLEELAPPSEKCLAFVAENAVDSATGPDGLPYSAWRFAGMLGCRVLVAVLELLLCGALPPLSLF